MTLEEIRYEAKKLGYRLIPLNWKRQELAGEKVTSKPKQPKPTPRLEAAAKKIKFPLETGLLAAGDPVEREVEAPPEKPKVSEEVRQLRLQLKAAGAKFDWAEVTRLQKKLVELENKK